jgi:hypothetical protein
MKTSRTDDAPRVDDYPPGVCQFALEIYFHNAGGEQWLGEIVAALPPDKLKH